MEHFFFARDRERWRKKGRREREEAENKGERERESGAMCLGLGPEKLRFVR